MKKLFENYVGYEKYFDIKKLKKPISLAPDNSYVVEFIGNDIEYLNKEVTLQLRGEMDINPKWRCERSYPILYRRICESLIGDELQIKGNGEPIVRACYYKAYADEINDAKNFTFSIEYKADIRSGEAKANIEIYYVSDKERTVASDNADITETIDLSITDGYEIKEILLKAEKEIDFIYINVMTDGLDGEIMLKTPELTRSNGVNIIEKFKNLPLTLETHRWIGENLSQIEWVPLTVFLNGQEIFHGRKFERIYNMPAIEFDLDSDIISKDVNKLEIRYDKTYNNQIDYLIRDVKIITRPDSGIVAYEKRAVMGENSILLKSASDNTKVEVSCNNDKIYIENKKLTVDKGLFVVKYTVLAPFAGETDINIKVAGQQHKARIIRFIEKRRDVVTGSGDSVYISLNEKDMTRFYEWYMANNLGQSFTFRTSYRWSGSQYTTDLFWSDMSKLLIDMNMRYNIMVDGRELGSSKTNGDGFDENTPNFDGYQSHEQDGVYYYWGSAKMSKENIFFNELCGRRFSKDGMLPKGGVVRRNNEFFKHFDGYKASNMEEAANYYIDNLRRMATTSTRHTGPSMTFKYIMEAGIKWIGAELMYGTFDMIISGLRGTSLAFNNKSYGGHIAVQWSTSPHNTIFKYRRFLQSLYLCYMKGLDQINTEEGFYRMESTVVDYERDSEACINHSLCQSKFVDFVNTHNRRGELKTNIAFIYGKYESLQLFGNINPFSCQGKDWKSGAPENSWTIMRDVFYPKGKMRCVYRPGDDCRKVSLTNPPCPKHHIGFFTNLPYGDTDVTPIESSLDNLKRYKYLIMLGWNTCDSECIDKLTAYAKDGGTVLLSIPHLYTTVDRNLALTHKSHVYFEDNAKEFLGISDLHRDGNVKCVNAVPIGAAYNVDSNMILENKIGKGKVICVNQFAYPYEIKEIYTELIEDIARNNLLSEAYKGIVRSDGMITTSTFDANDRRVIYMLDVKWWKRTGAKEKAFIEFNGYKYKVDVERDVLNICTIFNDTAFVTADNTTDIISYNNGKLKLQGEENTHIIMFHKGKLNRINVELNGIQTIEIGG